jgi:hypothetical protein
MNAIILAIGPLLLRPLIEGELGGDLLAEANLDRWMHARNDLLQHGIYVETATKGGRDARTR